MYDITKEAKVFIVRNAMSPIFLEEIKRHMDTVEFMSYSKENNVREKKHGRRIRIASKEYSEFLVGKGSCTKRYGSQKMTKIEETILNSMNELLIIYAEFVQKVLGIKVRLADQLQEVKDNLGSGYGSHNDQSALCCKCPFEKQLEDHDKPEHMIVATYVISNREEKNCKVIWSSESGNGKVTVQTGDNDIHFQGIHCQTAATHKVETLEKMRNKTGVDDYRLVFSARATMHFQETEEMRLQRTRLHMYGRTKDSHTKEMDAVRTDYKYVNILHEGKSDTPELTLETTITTKAPTTPLKRKTTLVKSNLDDQLNLGNEKGKKNVRCMKSMRVTKKKRGW